MHDPRPWNFGALIKAARLLYHPLPAPAEGLLRISDDPAGWLCELRPLALVPDDGRSQRRREFYVWWEPDNGKVLVASSPYLRAVRQVKQPHSVIIDRDGRVVSRAALAAAEEKES